ncbi:alginate O-acetyltransferase AlgX-related protein [Novosphingobium sp. 9]|uniref:alginate O-acetyltransferase AlgX-related protein n=1 Tax=Novosphingobium sp. 9 TaxID=2025349 RepID=UPI0021B615B5|nr:hypothetical protein [Novosphingobium sp. 9]
MMLHKLSANSRYRIWFGLGVPVTACLAAAIGPVVWQAVSGSNESVKQVVSVLSPLQAANAQPLGEPSISTDWAAPAKNRLVMCDAARDPKSYKFPGVQVVEEENGWLFRRMELSAQFGFSDERIHDLVRELNGRLARNGTRLIILLTPPRMVLAKKHLAFLPDGQSRAEQVEKRYRVMLAQLRADGALVPDILGEADRSGTSRDQLTDPGDIHWTPVGALMAARAIARIVRADPRVQQVSPVSYHFSRSGSPVILEGLTRSVNDICGSHIPYPQVRSYDVPQRVGAGQSLLSKDNTLSLVVLGTSFSALDHRYNFSGFLGQATGLDVTNLSVIGGGVDEALGQYLSSGALEKDKPAYIIWEFTPTDLPRDTSIAVLRGLTGRACSNGLSSNVSFDPGESTAFGGGQLQKVSAGAATISLSSDNAALKKFTIRTRGFDGSAQSFDFDFERSASPPRDFKLRLPTLSGVEAITIQPATMIAGKIKASLCNSTT